MKIKVIAVILTVFAVSLSAQLESLNDEQITKAVEVELLVNKQIHSQLLNVDTEEGIVTLSGTTKTILQKEKAVELAETVKGVRSVIDRIEVQPEERADLAIKTDVETALLVDPVTDQYEIDVVVANGAVSLNGTVDSWAEKQLCADVAKSVRGVKDIINEIEVKPAEERPDAEIKQEVEGLLQNDVRIDETLITVKVQDDTVTLQGTVGSALQKRQAASKSWVPGVEAVVTDDLTVEYWAMAETRKKDPMEISDQEIKQALKDAYLYDARIYKFNPEITVKNGVVTLEGVVEDLRAKRAAEEDAKQTAGVWKVVNLIKVEPQLETNDMELQERVEAAFERNPFLNDRTIKVYAFDGNVYLSGHVPYYYQKQRAEDVAAKVNGVREVTNELTTEDAWVYKEDWELETDVKRELLWNPMINENDVSVRVDDGVVFLTGEVNNITEYREAEDEAREAGALSVGNYLEIAQMPESFSRENLR